MTDVTSGLFAQEIHKGTTINGRRVETMRTGVVNGQRSITVQFAETTMRKGKARNRLSAPVSYLVGTRVPGSNVPTTWAMPAGPVHRKPGTKLNGGWYGDGDDGNRADRHHRKIESITYA